MELISLYGQREVLELGHENLKLSWHIFFGKDFIWERDKEREQAQAWGGAVGEKEADSPLSREP